MGSSSPALSNMQFLFSYPPLPWLLPAPSLRRAWRPLRLFPMSTTPPAMSLSTIPLQLFPTSMMPPVMLPTLLPLKPRLTSMTPQVMSQCPTSTRSPLLPPLFAAPAVTYAAYPYTYGAYPYLHAGAHVVAPKVEVKAAEPAAVAPVTYAAYPHYGYAGYPYAVAAYHTGCVNNVGSVVPCA